MANVSSAIEAAASLPSCVVSVDFRPKYAQLLTIYSLNVCWTALRHLDAMYPTF